MFSCKSNTPILTDTASSYDSPNLYSKRTLESELSKLTSAKRICTPIGAHSKTHITRNLINEFILEESNPTVPLLSNTNQIPCKCGKFDHKRTNFSNCILNKSNINKLSLEEIESLNKKYNEIIAQSKDKEFNKYFNIAKTSNFQTSNVFGPYIQIDKSLPNHGRHIIPPRTLKCEYCNALVWAQERTGGTNKKPIYSICCSKGALKNSYNFQTLNNIILIILR